MNFRIGLVTWVVVLTVAAVTAAACSARPYLERGDVAKAKAAQTRGGTQSQAQAQSAAATQSQDSSDPSAVESQGSAKHRSACIGDDGKVTCPSKGKPAKNRHAEIP